MSLSEAHVIDFDRDAADSRTSIMVTRAMLGRLRSDGTIRSEFLKLCRQS
jgi:GTP cyclohydrolase I